MIEFLLVLNYKPNMELYVRTHTHTHTPVALSRSMGGRAHVRCSSRSTEFRDRFMSGETGMVYAVLYWLLQRIPELKKRAYLVRSLLLARFSGMALTYSRRRASCATLICQRSSSPTKVRPPPGRVAAVSVSC